MIRRLFVYGVSLGFTLLVCTQAVEAQCTGQYANDPTYAMLLPKDYAAQGNAAVTLTITPQGGVASHKATLTQNTNFSLHWTSWWPSGDNVTAKTYISLNGNSFQEATYWDGVTSGSSVYGPYGNPGDTVIFKFVLTDNTTGQQTQDRVTEIVIGGTAGTIAFQDGLDTNFYWQTITTGGGSSMLTSCQECQAGTTQHCINATHTPYSTIQLANDMSGESQLIQGVQSGNVARSNESLTFSASLAISVLPGDTGTISIDHKIICSMDGIIFEQTLPKPKTSPSGGSWNPSVTGELAFTKVALKVPTHCTPLVDPNGNVIGLHCDVAYYCTARSSPPDYQPTGLDTYHYTNPALVPPFWMSMAPGTALVFGRNQPGEIAVWYFPFATLHGVLINMGGTDPLLLDILSPAWVSDNSAQDCTKWISGISPWYMPKW